VGYSTILGALDHDIASQNAPVERVKNDSWSGLSSVMRRSHGARAGSRVIVNPSLSPCVWVNAEIQR
jgi:hypothetical protein